MRGIETQFFTGESRGLISFCQRRNFFFGYDFHQNSVPLGGLRGSWGLMSALSLPPDPAHVMILFTSLSTNVYFLQPQEQVRKDQRSFCWSFDTGLLSNGDSGAQWSQRISEHLTEKLLESQLRQNTHLDIKKK